MKKSLIAILGIVLMFAFVTIALAQTATQLMGTGLSAEKAKKIAERSATTQGLTVVNTSNTPVAGVTPASGNFVTSGSISGGAIAGSTGSFTGNISLGAGKGVLQPVAVPTMAATPVAGTNNFVVGVNVVPTVAANQAAIFPATPVAGSEITIYNNGANAVRAKAGGASTINGSTAGAYIPIAAKQKAHCVNTDGTDWACELSTVPTPAGP